MSVTFLTTAKPNNNFPGATVDIAHNPDLVIALVDITLVDAQCISPVVAELSILPHLIKEMPEIFVDRVLYPIDEDTMGDCRISPMIRESTIRRGGGCFVMGYCT